MPQVSLRVSDNIDIADINLQKLFFDIHQILGTVPKLDNTTCFGGLIKEDYSFVGLGDSHRTKIFLEIAWLETPERVSLKPVLAKELMNKLIENFKEPLKSRGLSCQPRVRISNLGKIDLDYFIYGE